MLKKINNWIHLWLGLISGVVVFIVSITGCMYVFHQEIEDQLEPWRFVEPRNEAFVPPTQLIDTAQNYIHGKESSGLTYGSRNEAAAVGFSSFENGKRSFSVVYLNPYTGQFIKKEETLGKGNFDFFHFIMDGHRALWLPYKIGQPIVGICTLIFLVLLITGLILWCPKKWDKKHLKGSLKVQFKSNFKRINHDLHNILGFYSLIFALMIAITGLVWSFQWFDNSLYFIASGGQQKPDDSTVELLSDSTKAGTLSNDSIPALDRAFYKAVSYRHDIHRIYLSPKIRKEDGVISIYIYHQQGKFYDRNVYHYDQYTLNPIRVNGDRYSKASFADQLTMLNYDIHTGAALGLVGKMIAFFVSLICASLPITGFLVWWNKKKTQSRNSSDLFQAKLNSQQ